MIIGYHYYDNKSDNKIKRRGNTCKGIILLVGFRDIFTENAAGSFQRMSVSSIHKERRKEFQVLEKEQNQLSPLT